ncbi:MAG TPA: glycosyltransferase family 4 protein [Ignavibacteria bacterium]
MKVLLVSPLPPPVGGMASVTIDLMNYFKRNDNGTTVFLCNTANNVKSITSPSFFLRFLTGIYKSFDILNNVRKIIKKEKPQVIHLSSSASFALMKDWLIIRLAKKKKIPVIMHWHFGRIPDLAVMQNWEWKLFCIVINKSNWSIVLDKQSLRVMNEHGFRKVSNIPNPVALEVEQKARELLNQKHQRQLDRLIFVGHIIKTKGIYELVEACSGITMIKELMIIGPYEEAARLYILNKANKRINGEWIDFTGTLDRDQVLELMLSSPYVALPSYTEGFPLVVIEAMAMGCAVIATGVGAIPEMLAIESDKPCGICVPVKNVDKLREAIITLITDPVKTETMGKNGNKRVLNNYTMRKVVEQYKSVWSGAAKK